MTVVDEVSNCRTTVGGFEYHSMMQAWLPRAGIALVTNCILKTLHRCVPVFYL
jgi:hypothetical protein